ncbi:MAG: Flp pilus assembly complex ATPase component TadA [Phycisphaerae bacterium]|nr:Flp pilus assembly complex ATPase component TadA [Phycisphaerae bacterium]
MDLAVLAVLEFGNTISLIKLVLFVGCFIGTLPLIAWIHRDAQAVGADPVVWTGAALGAMALGVLLWWVIPIFLVGLAVCVLAVGAIGLLYTKEHNSHVMDFDKLLTADHLKRLVSRKADAAGAMGEFVFVTKNNNQVPYPEARTPDFYGYKVAYDTISNALQRRVALMVFKVAGQGQSISYEIDGMATKQPELPKEQLDHLMRFLKLLGDLDLKEHRKPQKGMFRLWQGKNVIEWEVRAAGSTAGEQLSVRRVAKESVLRLSEVGLASDQADALKGIGQRKQGVFLVSGPAASGRTTTFYALLSEHDAYVNSISTLEKEPSAKLPSVTQEVYSLADTATATYARKLEEILRLGADVVGVAECQDAETARVICHGAREAKMLYVVLPGDSALQALGRWLKLVGDRKTATADLVGISCQRLVRKLCENCKQAYTPNPDILKKFNLPADKAKVMHRAGKVVYDKKGRESTCPQCQGTGFVGRTAVLELILFNDALREAVRQSKSLADIGTQFRAARMLYLQEQGLRKVLQGTTAINELVRVLTPAQKTDSPKPAAAE